MNLEQLFATDYANHHANGLAPDTIRMGCHAISKFSEFLGFDATLADLSDDALHGYQGFRLEQGAKPSTVNGECRPIFALWRWAWNKRLIPTRPNVPHLPVERSSTESEPWRFDEMQALLDECRHARGYVGPVPANLYWPTFNYCQWDLEERPKVMLALRWADVNWDSGRILLPSEVRGHHRKARSIYLPPDTRRALRTIEKPSRKLIFGGVTMPEFRVLFKQIVTAAGLSWAKYEASPVGMYRQFAIFRQAAIAVGRVSA